MKTLGTVFQLECLLEYKNFYLMSGNFLLIDDILIPRILVTEKDFLLVYKPPLMHTAPLKTQGAETLLEWVCREFPELAELHGRKEGEGGLLHRLDYETHGLLLVARTKAGMENLLAQQREDKMHKKYSAISSGEKISIPGFPADPLCSTVERFCSPTERFCSPTDHLCPTRIISAFRPYGPGRKAVRPMLNGDKKYITEIVKIIPVKDGENSLSIRIVKGFRHQIRCHLAWLGLPILNDTLYGGKYFGKGLLGLRATSISFSDPATGRDLCYSIPELEIGDI